MGLATTNTDDHEYVTNKLGDNSNVENSTISSKCSLNKKGNLSLKNLNKKKSKENSLNVFDIFKDAVANINEQQNSLYDSPASEPFPSELNSNGYTSGFISLDIPPTKNNKDNDIIEKQILANNYLTKRRLSKLNIVKDDGTVITGYSIAHPKRNKDFHNFFKQIPENEYLVNDYSCALQKDIFVQGKMFISLNYIGFHSNILGWVTDIVIPFSGITAIEKKMTAFVIPNAIQITTKDTKYLFASFLSRDSVYELLLKLWNHCNKDRCSDSNEANETNEKEINYVHRETFCDCLKNNQHFNNLILDTEFKGSIEKIYNLLYTSGFTYGYLKENNDDINIGEWTKDDNKLVRQSNFTKRLNHSIGPKSTKCYIKDEILHQDFDKYVTIMTSTDTPNVPSGGTFTVRTRTCMMWASSNITRVIVTSAIDFSRDSLFKSTIEKACLEGQFIYYKGLEAAVRKYISLNLVEFDSESTSLFSNKTDDEEDVIQNPTMKEKEKTIKNEDTTKYKLRMPSLETLIIIALLLTFIANIYVLTGIKKINSKVEYIECQNKADENFWDDT
ncbi:GRAM domain-containing protein [Glomus cerebriforme]|uniref:GRAM domain-containing protein n=1 Tax=Glomus cerebriforme TaxID=658196 RepID=A0A397TJ75_9GLOM|nr:GRAM domain-containing protein [Glomus cerebriforme]